MIILYKILIIIKRYGTGENKLEGKELYEKILGTSKTTNKEVDTRYGSGKNK